MPDPSTPKPLTPLPPCYCPLLLLQALPDGDWFCSSGCRTIKDFLCEQVLAGDTPVESEHTGCAHGYTWQLLKGKDGSSATTRCLRTAVEVLQVRRAGAQGAQGRGWRIGQDRARRGWGTRGPRLKDRAGQGKAWLGHKGLPGPRLGDKAGQVRGRGRCWPLPTLGPGY